MDAICGAGKSSALINKFNEDMSDTKYLYITPFLTEVKRIKESCPNKHFKEPEISKGITKLNNIKSLLSKGENIVSTHALFKKIDEEIAEIIEKNNYVLVMDEVADVVDTLNITKDDLSTILEKYTFLNQKNELVWKTDLYEGKFDVYKEVIQNNIVMVYKDFKGVPTSLIWLFPIKIFKSFKDIYILTYMFNGQIQKYYYDMYGFEYEYLYVKDMHLTTIPQTYNENEIKKLIKICNNNKLNDLGKEKNDLSSSWFDRNKKTNIYRKLRNNIYNFFHNISKSESNDNLWTTFKGVKTELKGKGYAKSFVPINIRATNEYGHRTNISYIANRYLNPIIKNFFLTNKINVDEDMYALSELIQFIFRGAIRNNKEIYVYIPSRRMRNLLQKWIDKK